MADEPNLPATFARSEHQPDHRYRLRRDELVSSGIRRIARGQLVRARDQLAAASLSELPVAVHETRKRVKRLRAAMRLSRDAVGQPTYERENAALRRTARRLSAGRDAQVLVETLDELGERFLDELPARTTAALRERLDAERAERSTRLGDVDDVLEALHDAHGRTSVWTFEDDGFEAVSPGLRRIYRRGRKRMRAAAADPSPEHLHEWRKRVKDLWHATQILRAAHPKRMKRMAKRAHSLADLLGDGHDLSMLREYADEHLKGFEQADDLRALLAAIDRREATLRDEALKLGRKLYDKPPKRFVKRVERGWRKRVAGDPRGLAG